MVTAYLLPGVHVESYTTGIIVALVMSVLNAVVKPIMVIITLPVTVVTLGLFLLVINALIIQLASSLVGGFHVDGFWWALIFSLLLSFVVGIFNRIDKQA